MSLIIGADLQSSDGIFLGVLASVSVSGDSICDPTGPYGSAYSQTSIRNQFGPYGDPYGTESAFNLLATDPPVVIRNGELLGVLSISPFFINAIDPNTVLTEIGCP